MQAGLVLLSLFCVAHASEVEKPSFFETTQRPNLQAVFVNLDKSTDRASCISRQLSDHRIDNVRFAASEMPTCPDFDFGCVTKSLESNKDCFKHGADLIHIFTHGSEGKQSKMKTAAGVLANWCSHKRLFQQIQTNHSSGYDFKNLLGGNQFLQKKGSLLEEKKSEKVYVIMEDDAILKPGFGDTIEDFVQNYKGAWDMVQIDTFGSTRDQDKIGEYKNISLFKPSALAEYFGLHCLLVKESSVPKLNFEMGLMPAVPVDWFPKLLKDVPDTTVLAWNPDIVINPEVKTFDKKDASFLAKWMPHYCEQSVTASTIGGV